MSSEIFWIWKPIKLLGCIYNFEEFQQLAFCSLLVTILYWRPSVIEEAYFDSLLPEHNWSLLWACGRTAHNGGEHK